MQVFQFSVYFSFATDLNTVLLIKAWKTQNTATSTCKVLMSQMSTIQADQSDQRLTDL